MFTISNILIFVTIAILVILGVWAITSISQKKTKSSIMTEDLIEQYIAFLGGKDNMVRAFQEGGRTKITVNDTLSCNFQKLKELGASSIFISGNTVKMMCQFDTSSLVDTINQM